MTGAVLQGTGPDGFEAPIHRSLTEPILLGGAPRGLAILGGTLSAALALGLQQWLAGLLVWALGHSLCVFAAKRDPDFAAVILRHLRHKGRLAC
ncbi:MAG: VirB3 family type IV secretion system protein [Sphingomonas sp.]